mmetsp:Transcript_69427/g.180852  ORF Transcript_69427/g.180852 Transcript_69427/m.180852 type:complete len:331 (-) Transcript_69427:662-1654(-)
MLLVAQPFGGRDVEDRLRASLRGAVHLKAQARKQRSQRVLVYIVHAAGYPHHREVTQERTSHGPLALWHGRAATKRIVHSPRVDDVRDAPVEQLGQAPVQLVGGHHCGELGVGVLHQRRALLGAAGDDADLLFGGVGVRVGVRVPFWLAAPVDAADVHARQQVVLRSRQRPGQPVGPLERGVAGDVHHPRRPLPQRRQQELRQQERREVIHLRRQLVAILREAAAVLGGSVVHQDVQAVPLLKHPPGELPHGGERFELQGEQLDPALARGPALLAHGLLLEDALPGQLRLHLVRAAVARDDHLRPRVGEHDGEFEANGAAAAGDHSMHVD